MAVARQGTTAIASKARIMLRQILGRILSAARWGGWLALPGGLTLGLFAASVLLHSTLPDEPVRSDTLTVAPGCGRRRFNIVAKIRPQSRMLSSLT